MCIADLVVEGGLRYGVHRLRTKWSDLQSDRMEREPVTSSLVESVGYDPDEEILEVELENGRIYQYREVAENTYQEFRAADSLGRYFNHYIRELSHVRVQ